METLVNTLPPQLVILDHGSAPAPVSNVSEQSPNSSGGGQGFAFIPDGGSSSAAPVTSGAGTKPRTTPRSPGPRKEGGGMGIEIVKVVLGGLAAFPLIQMVVWWGFGRDPMDLGPTVRKIPGINIVVPKEFPNEEGYVEDEDSDDEMIVDENENKSTKKKPLGSKK